jgi:UDP-N-acetylmuramoyl-tripeptide--D-alanyl-D-alanine ligase
MRKGGLLVTEITIANHPQCICVDECAFCLAAFKSFSSPSCSIPVNGITGTNGKTTTKELIVQCCKKNINYLIPREINNLLGYP